MWYLKYPIVEPTEVDAKLEEAIKNLEKAVIQFNLGEDKEKIGRSYYKLGCCFLEQGKAHDLILFPKFASYYFNFNCISFYG